jgi:hypothetical protein
MLKIVTPITLCIVSTLSMANQPSDDFTSALKRYGQSMARETLASLIEQRGNGHSWKTILGEKLPKELDDRCGYRDLVGLPEKGFSEMRNAVLPVAGDRIVRAFSEKLARPSAKLNLNQVSIVKGLTGDQTLVVLDVQPKNPGDRSIGLLFQLNNGGRMSLCDVIDGSKPNEGILYNIGRELGN